MKITNIYIFMVLGTFSLIGCTSKELYKSAQINQQQNCLNNAKSDAHYAECMKENIKPYDEYKKDRKELIEDTHVKDSQL